MTLYHKMFDEIEPEVIKEVRSIIKKGLFKKENSVEIRQNLIIELNKNLSTFYGFREPKIRFIDDFVFIGQTRKNEIILNKPSLVTFLHEFAHYKFIKKKEQNSEERARGWSISCFYLATPKLCQSAIEKGLILHQKSMVEEERKPVQEEQEEE